jgi:hypothetical protein
MTIYQSRREESKGNSFDLLSIVDEEGAEMMIC